MSYSSGKRVSKYLGAPIDHKVVIPGVTQTQIIECYLIVYINEFSIEKTKSYLMGKRYQSDKSYKQFLYTIWCQCTLE